MQLTTEHLEQFDREGYLFLPDMFTAAEAALLNREAQRVFSMDREEVVREKDGKTARTAFAAQNYK